MRHSKLIAAAGAAILTAGLSMVLAPVASATTPPWEPDPQSVGTITFYDANGNQITSGNVNDQPIAAYFVGSATIHAGDNTAVIQGAQPNPQQLTANWNRDQMTFVTGYPLTSGPANIVALSQTHPVVTGSDQDFTIQLFIDEFPNTDPSGIGCAYSPTPAGCTNTAYQNIYQLELKTATGSTTTDSYDDADILVDPATGNWTQVWGGTPTPDNTSLTMSAPSLINYGGTAKLSTVLKDTTTNKAISGAHVVLKRRANSSKPWTTVSTLTTSTTGAASKSLKPTANAQYEWTYAGDTTHKVSTSAVKSVSVAQVVGIHSTKSSVRHGVSFRIWGSVKPSGAGQKVTLQHLVGKTWKSGPTATLKKQKMPNGSTTVGYVFTVKESTKGTYKFRVHKAATSTLAAGTSPTVTVKVT